MPAPARRRRPPVEKHPTTRDKLRESLLSWYDRNARSLPWRTRGGPVDPYRVWLSEVMLQQTTVATVAGRFAEFLTQWRNVAALAAASREEVLAAWAGLGYYSRARNLHAASQVLAAKGFPRTEAEWRALPGVGAYTAAAIAAIAFNQPANVVDGNVERVFARLRGVEAPLHAARAALRVLAAELVTEDRPGDWAQALMDLGATVCTPRSPKCDACPWTAACIAHASGAPERYPRRAAKAARPERFGAVYRIAHEDKFWLVRRPERGLLAGMVGLPTTEWSAKQLSARAVLAQAPVTAAWKNVGAVRHIFTHFALTLDVYAADATPSGDGWWDNANALPTVFKKAAALTPA